VADGVESLGEIEGYDNDIMVGLEQAGDGVEKGNDGSRRGTSGTESKLIRKSETGWGCQDSYTLYTIHVFKKRSHFISL